MSMDLKAIIFDVDGTLVDSLGPHVQFCHDMNKKHCCNLDLPPVSDGRSIAAAPMVNFIRKAGFPENLVDDILQEYETEFKARYPVHAFPGVDDLLEGLRQRFGLFVVTSNTSENVVAALGNELADKCFKRIYGIDNGPLTKTESIGQCLKDHDLKPSDVIYVGDTHKDWTSATANEVPFIGVSYGFEFQHNSAERREAEAANIPIAGSIAELKRMLET